MNIGASEIGFRINFAAGSSVLLAALLAAAVPAFGQNAYVDNFQDGTVSVIDTTDNLVVATIPVGANPNGVAIAPDGSTVYVADRGFNVVAIIDAASNTVSATLPVNSSPVSLAITSDGNTLLVTSKDAETVSAINTATNSVGWTVGVSGLGYGDVVVTPDGSKAYTANFFAGTVSAINIATHAIIATISGFNGPLGLAVSPDGGTIYVVNLNSNTVSIVDTGSNTVIGTVPVGSSPVEAAVAPDGSRVFVTNAAASPTDPGLSVIDRTTNTVTSIGGFGSPAGIALTRDGSTAYVGNDLSNTVSVLDTATNTIIATIPVGIGPAAIRVSPVPLRSFVGTPGVADCQGQSESALTARYRDIASAAKALRYQSVQVLQSAIRKYCKV